MIAVTGATGHLGRLVIENLLGRGVAPSEIVAAVRSPGKAADPGSGPGQALAARDLPAEEHVPTLVKLGLPEDVATLLADFDRTIAQGYLLVESGDLRRLIGHPATPLADAVADALPA